MPFLEVGVCLIDSAAVTQQAGASTLCPEPQTLNTKPYCVCRAVGLVSQPYADNMLEAARKPLATVEQLSEMTLHELYLKSP